MAPSLNPDSQYFDIDAANNVAIVRPSGNDLIDWDNTQTVMNDSDIAGNPNALVRIVGTHRWRYPQVYCQDFSGKIRGAGKDGTTIFPNLPGVRQELLDLADRNAFGMPNAWPSLFRFSEAKGGGTPIVADFDCMTLRGSDAPGYQGLAFGGLTHLNIGLESLILATPSESTVGRFDIPLVMNTNGTDPTPTGFADISRVFVQEETNHTGVEFVEGVDYSVDLAASSITRLVGGGASIPSGATIFASFSVRADAVVVSVSNVKIGSDMRLAGGILEKDGIRYPNVDVGVRNRASLGIRARSSASGVFNSVVITEIFPSQRFDQDFFRPNQPGAGSLILEDGGEYEDMSTVWTNQGGCEGTPIADGGHTYPASVPARGRIKIGAIKCTRIGFDNLGFFTGFQAFSQGIDVELNKGEYIDCPSLVKSSHESNMAFIAGFSRFAGWVGADQSFSGSAAKMRGIRPPPTEFGPFAFEIVDFDDAGGSDDGTTPFDARNASLVDCDFEVNGVMGRAAVNLEQQVRAYIAGNTFRTVGDGIGREAVNVVGRSANGSAEIMETNDFSQWKKQEGRSDIRIDSGSNAVRVHADEDTLIEDQGTLTERVGGTLSTIVN